MARTHFLTAHRILVMLLLAVPLAACDYGGSPSGSVSAGDIAPGDPAPEPVLALLGWGEATGPVDGYHVYESRDGGSYNFTETVPDPSTTVSGLPGETLQVTVRAVDSQGNTGPLSTPSEVLVFGPSQVAVASPALTGAGEAPAEETTSALGAMLATAPVVEDFPASGDDTTVPVTENRAARLDMNGDAATDLLWESAEQDLLRVTGSDGALVAIFDRPPLAWQLVALADLDGDGFSDLLWADDSGELALSRMALSLDTQPVLDFVIVGSLAAEEWIRTTGDFDGDGVSELLVQDSGTGALALWTVSGDVAPAVRELGLAPAAGQVVAGSRSYDGVAGDDLLFQGSDGSLAVWLLDAGGVSAVASLAATAGGEVLASGDFDGDGVADVARRSAAGGVELLLLGGGLDAPGVMAGLESGAALEAVGAGDYDGDGRSDLLWRDASGELQVWFIDPELGIESVGLVTEGGWNLVADWR